MVTKLANLLRYSLYRFEESTTVEREIEHAANYLDIEMLRSNRPFQYFVQVDPALKKTEVIKLILQPIVENAVKHGVNKLTGGNGKIRLTAKRSGREMWFVVEDNGPGGSFPAGLDKEPQAAVETAATGAGIGLANVHKRIRLHYGAEYGIQVDENYRQGFRITIRLPLP